MNRKFYGMKARSFFVAILMSAASMQSAASLEIADKPLFLVSIPPIVMVMLDNSGSMKAAMYSGSYNNSTSYHGIFESETNYEYDSSIPVNASAYVASVDTTATGAFVESACTPGPSNNSCWKGNFLNWLSTRRIDSSRKVLIGGKLESRTGYDYKVDGGGTRLLSHKIMANNEFEDRDITKSDSASSSYSPIPDSFTVRVYSPADVSGGAAVPPYDPYAKITATGATGIIYDAGGSPIGEFGQVVASDSPSSVSFSVSYTSAPIVVAKPATYNGGDDGVVNITALSSSGFSVQFLEWEHANLVARSSQGHTDETIPYIVMKKGWHTLPGGLKVLADSAATNKLYVTGCSVGKTDYKSEPFRSGDSFSSTPVVIHTVNSFHDSEPVNSRAWDISTSGMKVALQEEEANAKVGGHPEEEIGYIAFEQGGANDGTNGWSLEAGLVNNVTHTDRSFSFSNSFGATPAFLASLNTMNGGDTTNIRTKSVSTTGAQIFLDEETSCDTETRHVDESVAYVALQGSGDLNLAIAVNGEPTGLLQDIEDQVRLGLSFYRYDFNSNNIYNSETNNGGTLKFKIPKNPFVKKPSDTSLPSAERNYRELTGYIGSEIADIVDAIEHYPLVWGTTPLAENLWEVIQYFEQDSPYYAPIRDSYTNFDLADTDGDGSITDELEADAKRDPFYYPDYQYNLSCAAPSVILFTDGEPYKDAAIPAALADYDDDSHEDDDSDLSNAHAQPAGRDNLDDVAYWGFCDKSDTDTTCPDSSGDVVQGNRDLRSDLDDNQPLRVYTVGFAGGSIRQILQDTADNAGGTAYAASDGTALEDALTDAFNDVISSSSASAVSLDTGSITNSTTLYQARFDGSFWTGEVRALAIGDDGVVATSPTWRASRALVAHGSRSIFTHDGTNGVEFLWANLTTAQKALLDNNEDLLHYLRGDTSNEDNDTGFRERPVAADGTELVLGDIVHSSPQFVGAPGAPYPDNWNGSTSEPEDSVYYSSFVSTNSSRTPIVYVGGNDGMLHAFNAETGAEVFGYIPNELMNKLELLSDPSYAHRFYVDGTPVIVDAFWSSAWHSVLVGGLGAGGQGVYALDVTSPGTFGASKVLWEFSDDDDAELGYTFSQPNVVRMQNGKWAAVFGNGFDNTEPDGTVSTTGKAKLYIRDVSDGSEIKDFLLADDADVSAPNGMASVSPIDLDGDFIVDYIYAGDLKGNVWRFDVTSSSTASWTATKIFTACDHSDCANASANRQPITSRLQVGRHPQGQEGVMVYFGTGKYFEFGDDSPNDPKQTFYAVWDRWSGHQAFDRDHMLQQTIKAEVAIDGGDDTTTDDDYEYRVVSDTDINWHSSTSVLPSNSPPTTHLGWYIDLVNTQNSNTNPYGEKQVSNSILRGDRIIFTTLIPSEDPCEAGGTGWIMELDVENGGRLPYTPFEVNGDGSFSRSDYVTTVDVDGDGDVDADDVVPVSGRKSKIGIIQTPGILADPENGKEYKYTSGSSGEIELTVENPGPTGLARQSWRQLY